MRKQRESPSPCGELGNNVIPETLGNEDRRANSWSPPFCFCVRARRLRRGGGPQPVRPRPPTGDDILRLRRETWSTTAERRAMHRSILRTDLLEERKRLSVKDVDRRSSKIPLRHHFKVHLFRGFTVVLAWFLIIAAFYERPEALTATQRLIQRGIESLGDAIPSPWGPRIEFVFREIGGFIWLQITLFVVMLRIVLSTLAATWRFILRRDRTI